MSLLFSPITLRGLRLRNRTVIAPMCQYSSQHGMANDFHLVHLGRFALGGFGLIILEATGIAPEARISYGDLGLWNDKQIAPLKRIVDFLHQEGAAAGIQLAHAGRKASTPIAWRNGFDETEAEKPQAAFESWTPIAPSPILHPTNAPGFTMPREMTVEDIKGTVEAFAAAAGRADVAGFDTVEIHGAHGYLINEFLSPIGNQRTDEYGGSRENRMHFPLEVASAIRSVWPAHKPLLMRISATDAAAEGGWTLEDSQVLVKELTKVGVDAIDVSSGGISTYAVKPGPLYQVDLARQIKQTGATTIAVGLIDDPKDAEMILETGQADMVAFARGALEEPNWPVRANQELDGDEYGLYPKQARYRMRGRDEVLGRLRS